MVACGSESQGVQSSGPSDSALPSRCRRSHAGAAELCGTSWPNSSQKGKFEYTPEHWVKFAMFSLNLRQKHTTSSTNSQPSAGGSELAPWDDQSWFQAQPA